MTAPAPDHPLARTVARARGLSAYLKLRLGAPAGDGWLSAGDLAPGAAWLEALAGAEQARLRTSSPAVVASAILQSYQWPLIGGAIACYLLDRRVPDVGAANVRTGYTAAHVAESLTLLRGRFAALPDDPAAGHPDALVVPDLPALRAALRAGLEVHLGPVIDGLCARFGCRPRGLWLHAADRCAGTLVWLMQEFAPAAAREQIEVEVDALVHAPGSPLESPHAGLIELTHAGRIHVFPERATCCHWHRTEGGGLCATCPKRRPADRRACLLSSLADRRAPPLAAAEEETLYER